MGTAAPADSGGNRLRENSIGTTQVVFQGLAGNGPALSVATGVVFLAVYVGPALPLAVLFAFVAVLLVASCYAQLAKRIPSAGHVYAFVSRGIGPKTGFVVGFTNAASGMLILPLLLLAFAWLVEDVVKSEESGLGFGGATWGIWVVAAGVFAFAVTYFDVRISANVGIVLGSFEIAIFVALALWMIFSNAGENTVQVLNPSHSETGTVEGFFKGVVFALLAFGGFDIAASFGEEARNPRRTIPRAILLGAFLIGTLLLVCSYATVVGYGFGGFTEQTLGSPNPWRDLGESYWGAGWVLIFLAIANAALGATIAVANFEGRLLFALGRNGVLPGPFARTHPTRKTPYVGLAVACIGSTAIALVAGWQWGGPLSALIVLGISIAVVSAVTYALTCLATMVFYRREGRASFNPLLHGVFPVVGAVVFLVPIYYQFSPLPDYPSRWANWFVLALFASAVVAALALARARPRVLTNAERIFVADDRSEAAPATQPVAVIQPATVD
jgi:amino acid transporter